MANRLINVDEIVKSDGTLWTAAPIELYSQVVMDHDTANTSNTPSLFGNTVLLSVTKGDFQWKFIHSDGSETILEIKNLGVDHDVLNAGSGTIFLADKTNWDNNGTEATIVGDPTGKLAKTFKMPDGRCALNHVPFAGGPSNSSGGIDNYEYNSDAALAHRMASRSIGNNGSISISDRADCCNNAGYGDWCGGSGYNGRHWWRVWGTHYFEVRGRCHQPGSNSIQDVLVGDTAGITGFQILMT